MKSYHSWLRVILMEAVKRGGDRQELHEVIENTQCKQLKELSRR